jgi:hypothetical protein
MNEKVSGHKMLKVRATLWHRLKILAVKNNMPLQDLTERALTQWLKYSPTLTSTTKDNGK